VHIDVKLEARTDEPDNVGPDFGALRTFEVCAENGGFEPNVTNAAGGSNGGFSPFTPQVEKLTIKRNSSI
jgi:hypothetical protein